MKTNRFDGIKTIEELVISLFPVELDEVAGSNKPKRSLSKEWLEWYINGGTKPQFTYKTSYDFAYGLWAAWHDETDNFFKDRRDDLVELIETWKSDRI